MAPQAKIFRGFEPVFDGKLLYRMVRSGLAGHAWGQQQHVQAAAWSQHGLARAFGGVRPKAEGRSTRGR